MERRSVLTQSGDMWDAIAYRVYGDRRRGELLMHLLLAANPQHNETVIFPSGVLLAVPDAPIPVSESLPPWKR